MSYTTIADARIIRGMQSQLAMRRQLISAGAKHLGWKAGFGSRAAMERLGTSSPLFGFMLDRNLVEAGAAVSLAGWKRPVLEAEIAVYLGADASIAALGPAIELADLDPATAGVEEILAGDIFHRHVLLGDRHPGTSVDEIEATIFRDGAEIARTTDPAQLTGGITFILEALAEILAANGEALRTGDVVITGSVVPPIDVAPGQTLLAKLGPLGNIEVRFQEVGG